MSTLKKLASQTAVYGLSQIIGRFLNYLLVPLYTGIFAPEQYGVVTEMYAYVTFFIVLLTYGMETAFFRFSEKSPDRNKVFGTATTSILISSGVFALLGLVFAQPVADMLRYPDHPEYIRWFVMILALDAIVAIPFARLRQLNKPLKFATVKLLNIGINVGLNLFFLLGCPAILQSSNLEFMHGFIDTIYNYDIGIGYIFISNLIASLITVPLLAKELSGAKYGLDKKLWKEMFLYALPLMVVGFAGMINETLDRVILKYLLPPETAMHDLGVYGAVYKLSMLMTLFIQAYRYAAEPFFFNYAKNSDSRVMYSRIMNIFVIICCVVFLGVTLFLDFFKHFLQNEAFWEGLKVVPVLLLANMFLGIYINLSIWYKLGDKTNLGARISIMGAGVTIVLNLLLIPILGYMGSAWATLAAYLTMAVLNYLYGQKHYPIPYDLKKIGLFIGSSIALYFIGRLVSNSITDTSAKYAVNAVLLMAFVVAAYISERPNKVVNSPE